MKLDPHDAAYPRSVLDLDEPPPLTVSGHLAPSRIVAIVGSRQASAGAASFAHQLGYHLASAGIVVVSGGAVGVDAAAHVGAMKRGATWAVMPCGRGVVSPHENDPLFKAIEASSTSRMIWPLPDGTPKDEHTPRYRNQVLVALASAIIVVQAAIRSGSLNAARWVKELRRPLYVVPGEPWNWDFEGSKRLISSGDGTPLWSVEQLFHDLGLPAPDMSDPDAILSGNLPLRTPIRTNKRRVGSAPKRTLWDPSPDDRTAEENRVISVLSDAPTQQDRIIDKCGLGASATLTALLTLSLKDVVVEAPDGFFRRRKAS